MYVHPLPDVSFREDARPLIRKLRRDMIICVYLLLALVLWHTILWYSSLYYMCMYIVLQVVYVN